MATLTPVEEDSLMSPEELEAQKEWDAEFERRKQDLQRQQLKSRERRRFVGEKMAELQNRWQGVERRRDIRSRESRNRPSTNNTLSVPSAGNNISAISSGGNSSNDVNNNNDNNQDHNASPGLNR